MRGQKGGFPSHERSHVHKYCLELLSKPHRGIAEILSSDHERQMAINRDYLRKVLENIIFLSRQGLPFRGNWVSSEDGGGAEVDSNFHQLHLLRAQDDPAILEIMQRKSCK